MSKVHQITAALAMAVALAGCGAQAGLPPVSSASSELSAQAIAVTSNQKAQAMINRFKAVTGRSAASQAKRAAIIDALGQMDNDLAAQFLMAQYDDIRQHPENGRQALRNKILYALVALDTFDPSLEAVAPVQGTAGKRHVKDVTGDMSAQSSEMSASAAGKKQRHNAFIRWATEPLRWLDDGLRWFLHVVNGTPSHRKKNPPAPAPDPGPDPAPGPAPGPAGPGGGGAPAPAGP